MSSLASSILLAAATACPFCTAPQATLAERRETAAVAALGELRSQSLDGQSFQLHAILKGQDRLADAQTLRAPIKTALAPGRLALLFGSAAPVDESRLDWEAIPVDETSYGYFARAPDLRTPAAQRLAYFVRFLEHADPTIAADAYGELARAPYDQVAAIADRFVMADLRAWLASPGVPQERKGLYGMVLGLARSDPDRRLNTELLRSVIEAPASDYRAGFDGVLGGYLLARGEAGLELIERRLLANPDARRGDLLHAMTALRFYHESGRDIPPPRLARALALLLRRTDCAAAAITDLARWQAWDHLAAVVDLFGRPGYEDAATERAIVGFLLVCPTADARAALARLRDQAPQRVAEAQQSLSRFGGPR